MCVGVHHAKANNRGKNRGGVLTYARNPKQRKRICRENRIGEELLTKWYEEFDERANQIFSNPAPRAQQAEVLSADNNLLSKQVVEKSVSKTTPTWGARLNRGWRSSLQSLSSSKELPAWLRGMSVNDWESERGLVVWDNTAQKMEVLRAEAVLELLRKLRAGVRWRSEGIAITIRFRRQISSEQPDPNRSRKEKIQDEPPASASETEPVYEDVEEERLRLPPEAGAEVFAFLQEHEASLRQMTEEDEKQRDEALRRVYQILFRWGHEQEPKEIDFSSRPLPWVHNAKLNTWVCDSPPNRGTVRVEEKGWWWESRIEQPDHFKRSGAFRKDGRSTHLDRTRTARD